MTTYDATGSLSETARITGIPDSTIHGWLLEKRDTSNPDIPLMRAGYELKPLDLAARFEEIADRATGEVVSRLRNSKETANAHHCQPLVDY
jgi:hypothetical protein